MDTLMYQRLKLCRLNLEMEYTYVKVNLPYSILEVFVLFVLDQDMLSKNYHPLHQVLSIVYSYVVEPKFRSHRLNLSVLLELNTHSSKQAQIAK